MLHSHIKFRVNLMQYSLNKELLEELSLETSELESMKYDTQTDEYIVAVHIYGLALKSLHIVLN